MNLPEDDLTQMYMRGDTQEIARFELHRCLQDQRVQLTESEFEAVLSEQTDMRAAHDALTQSMDRGECSPEQYLDRLEVINSTSLVRTREIMGADRYRQFFDTDETHNVLSVDRDLFLSLNQAGSSTRRD